jgi:hypothetical protein
MRAVHDLDTTNDINSANNSEKEREFKMVQKQMTLVLK